MRFNLVKVFMLISCFGFSQNSNKIEVTISGVIYSEVNNKPLKDVYIMSKTDGDITNSNGEFKFISELSKENLNIKIQFSAVGYKEIDTIIDIEKKTNVKLNLTLKPRYNLNRKKALEDIKKGEINILESSGIAPILYESDKKFTHKYKVNFIDYGCDAVANESLYEYNKTVFEYLDSKFGPKWRKHIRKGIIGLD